MTEARMGEAKEEEEVIEIHETVETTDIAAAAQAENGMYTHSYISQEVVM